MASARFALLAPSLGALLCALTACTPPPRPADTARRGRPLPSATPYECHFEDTALPPDELRRLDHACAVEKRTTGRGAAGLERHCACTRLAIALWHPPVQARRATELMLDACEEGSITACDSFEVTRSLCLQQPDDASCDVLREAKLIPREAFPLEAALGCFTLKDATLLCLSRTELHVRRRNADWTAVAIKSWRREDLANQPRWAAELAYEHLLLKRGELLEAPQWLVSPGALDPVADRERAPIQRALDDLADKLRSCDAAVLACWRAAVQRARPSGGEIDDSGPAFERPMGRFRATLRSLRACQADGAYLLAQLRAAAPSALPEACQVVHDSSRGTPATMTDPNLDLSAYEIDVVEHLLVGRARARMLEEIREGKPWNVALDRGELTIGGAAYQVQILGTYSEQSNTFLWAWANPGSAGWTPSLTVANALRTRAEEPGQAVYAEPKVAADWVNPRELALVAGEVSGGHPVFVGGYDGGAAFLLVTSLRLDFKKLELTYLPGIVLDLPSLTVADPRLCTFSFLERLGFEVDETESSLVATRADGRVRVDYDDQGRAVEVAMTAAGT